MTRLKRWLMTASLALAGLMAVLPARAELILVAGPTVTGAPGQTVIVPFQLTLDLPDSLALLGLTADFSVGAPLSLPSSPLVTLSPSTLTFSETHGTLPATIVSYSWLETGLTPQVFLSNDILTINVPVRIDPSAAAGAYTVNMVLQSLSGQFETSQDFYDFPSDSEPFPLEAGARLSVERPITAVDSPATLALLGGGLAFLPLLARRRRKDSEAFALRSRA